MWSDSSSAANLLRAEVGDILGDIHLLLTFDVKVHWNDLVVGDADYLSMSWDGNFYNVLAVLVNDETQVQLVMDLIQSSADPDGLTFNMQNDKTSLWALATGVAQPPTFMYPLEAA